MGLHHPFEKVTLKWSQTVLKEEIIERTDKVWLLSEGSDATERKAKEEK